MTSFDGKRLNHAWETGYYRAERLARGLASFRAIQATVNLLLVASGRYPEKTPEGVLWTCECGGRCSVQGRPEYVRCLLCEVYGDFEDGTKRAKAVDWTLKAKKGL